MTYKYFLLICCSALHSLNSLFWKRKAVYCNEIQFIIFFSWIELLVLYQGNFCVNQDHSFLFSSRCYIMFTLRSLISFESLFVVKYGFRYIFILHMDSQLFQHNFFKLSFLHWIVFVPLSYVSICVQVYLLHSTSLMSIQWHLDYYSFIIRFWSYLAILGPLYFYVKCRTILSVSTKKPAEILTGIAFSL